MDSGTIVAFGTLTVGLTVGVVWVISKAVKTYKAAKKWVVGVVEETIPAKVREIVSEAIRTHEQVEEAKLQAALEVMRERGSAKDAELAHSFQGLDAKMAETEKRLAQAEFRLTNIEATVATMEQDVKYLCRKGGNRRKTNDSKRSR